jgi:methyl-accepting chemotaxis protein
LVSKQVGKLKKSTSLTAENVSKWVDDVSGTLKKLYKEKAASSIQGVNEKAEKFKQDFSDKLSEFNTKLSQKIESVKDLSSQAQDKILSEFVNAYINSFLF